MKSIQCFCISLLNAALDFICVVLAWRSPEPAAEGMADLSALSCAMGSGVTANDELDNGGVN